MKQIVDLIFPPRCPICQDIVTLQGDDRGDGRVCTACKPRLSYVSGDTCMICGKELEPEDVELCGDCKRRPKHFVKGFPAFNYTDAMATGVTALKYHNRKEYASFYADAVLRQHGEELRRIGFDAVIPVPVHRTKLAKRGYNQAELIAKPIAKALSVPCNTKDLIRVEATVPQKELDPMARANNLKKAFILRQSGVKSNMTNIMLVDDIYTTGATMDAAASAIAGAANIYFLCICNGRR